MNTLHIYSLIELADSKERPTYTPLSKDLMAPNGGTDATEQTLVPNVDREDEGFRS